MLHDIQQDFTRHILSGQESPMLLSRIIGHGLTPAQRLEVYKDSVEGGLVQALLDSFPVTGLLVGDAFARAMALRYVQNHPLTQPVVTFYGHDYGDFIDDFEPAKTLPYLGDIARLEYMITQSFFADDDVSAGPDFLNAMATDPKSVTLDLRQSTFVMMSAYPVASIRDFCLHQTDDRQTLDLSAGAQCVLIHRPDLYIRVEIIDPVIGQFLQNLDRYDLEHALNEASQNDPSFDFGELLRFSLERHLLKGTIL